MIMSSLVSKNKNIPNILIFIPIMFILVTIDAYLKKPQQIQLKFVLICNLYI